jgi:hypothetical protein
MSASATGIAIEPAAVSQSPARSLISREKQSAVLCLVLALLTLAFYNPIVHNAAACDQRGLVVLAARGGHRIYLA